MAFNTQNPVPSSDPRDLSDNAENLDTAMQTTSLTWVDRLGQTRKTAAALESIIDGAQDQIDTALARRNFNLLSQAQSDASLNPSHRQGLYTVLNDPNPDNNGTWFWGGSALVKTDLQVAKDSDLKKVEYKTKSLEREIVSSNILDLSEVAVGFRIDNTNGRLFSAAAFTTSGFMPVKAGEQYRSSYVDRIAFYNAAGQFISVFGPVSQATAPANSFFARASFASNSISTSMFALAAKYPLTFEPYIERLLVPDLYIDLAQKIADDAAIKIKKLQTDFIERDSDQLFDERKFIVEKRINSANGGLLDYLPPGTGGVSDYIPVSPNTSYAQTEGNYFAEYDAQRGFVRGYAPGTTVFVTDPATRFVRVTVRNVMLPTYQFQAGTTVPTVHTPYHRYVLSPEIIVGSTANTRWQGKKMNVLGDSIVADSASYWRTIASNLEFSIARNYGIGGTSVAYRDAPSGASNPALYTEQWMANRYQLMSDDADFVLVAGLTNDFRQVPLGSFAARNNDTVYGALRILCEGLANKYPVATIAAILPFTRYDSIATTNPYTFMALRAAAMEVYAFYGVPYFDSSSRLPLRLYNSAQAALWTRTSSQTGLPDGLHPNEEGFAAIVPAIQSWILSL